MWYAHVQVVWAIVILDSFYFGLVAVEKHGEAVHAAKSQVLGFGCHAAKLLSLPAAAQAH
jgi:hypothetical protein